MCTIFFESCWVIHQLFNLPPQNWRNYSWNRSHVRCLFSVKATNAERASEQASDSGGDDIAILFWEACPVDVKLSFSILEWGRDGLVVKLKLAVCASDKCAVCLVNQLLHVLFSCLSSSSCDIREISRFTRYAPVLAGYWFFFNNPQAGYWKFSEFHLHAEYQIPRFFYFLILIWYQLDKGSIKQVISKLFF
jgi:hypothetical protein